MGLDMYLHAKRYVSGWDHTSAAEKKNFDKILRLMKLSRDDIEFGRPGLDVQVTVGYWRKANAIHAWFVKNVQAGVDNCNPHYVDREKLVELRGLCLSVLTEPETAMELLPPQSGFFFGCTAIDEGYLEDLKHTVKMIDVCLSPKFEGWDFEYQSSW